MLRFGSLDDMSTKSCNRRSKLVVDAPVQKRIILSVTVLPALALAATVLIVGMFCRRLISEAEAADIFLPSLLPLFISVLGFVVISGTIVVWCAFRFSHRIAGPSYRLVQACRQIRAGDRAFRVVLRKGDHLTEVAEALNDVMAWLDETHPEAPLANGEKAETVSASATEPVGS